MTSQSGSGGAPTGAAGGVLGGSYPSPTFASNGTSKILDSLSNLLAADVAMTNANQFYDGPAIALTAGTWLLTGGVTIVSSGTGGNLTPKLWDSTTAVSSGEFTYPTAGSALYLPISGVYVAVGAVTVKISITSSVGGCTLKAASTTNSPGNNASYLFAVRIA